LYQAGPFAIHQSGGGHRLYQAVPSSLTLLKVIACIKPYLHGVFLGFHRVNPSQGEQPFLLASVFACQLAQQELL
jgi:hypothetical protein